MSDDVQKWDELHALGKSVLESADAYTRFWLAVEPHLATWVAAPSFLGRVADEPEWQRDIVLLVWEKLQDREHAKLRAFFARESASKAKHAFRAWTRRVVKNTGIDYMRSLPEYIRHRKPKKRVDSSATQAPSLVKHWHSIASLHSLAKGERAQVTVEQTARKMLEYLDDSVPSRLRDAVQQFEDGATFERIASDAGLSTPEDAERLVWRGQDRLAYRSAIELWSQGYSETDIADLLELGDSRHARRLVNAAKEVLRRHFRD